MWQTMPIAMITIQTSIRALEIFNNGIDDNCNGHVDEFEKALAKRDYPLRSYRPNPKKIIQPYNSLF
jgi:hypothetical protein